MLNRVEYEKKFYNLGPSVVLLIKIVRKVAYVSNFLKISWLPFFSSITS